MTTPDAAAGATRPGMRLHPMSWLFELIAQLRQFLVPLLALLVFGPGDRSELWPLIGLAALVGASLWRYFAFRYQPEADQLVLRTGLLSRNVRVVPYGRIHNVAVDQTLLHRLFDVASVRLESAGGKKPEAEMRVLRLEQALALEDLIRHRGATSAVERTAQPSDTAGTDSGARQGSGAGTVLHHLPSGELLRLGIISNRGMVLIAAAFALVGQSGDNAPRVFEALGRWLFGWVDSSSFDTAQWMVAASVLLLGALVGVRLLSVLLAVLQFHGFTLAEYGRRLTVERGLLARWRTSTPRRRIQAWRMQEGVVHRLLDRRTLKVDIATGSAAGQEDAKGLRELAPVGTPAQCGDLVAHLLPGSGWESLEWMPFRPATWRRLFWPSLPLVALVATALCWRFGAPGLLAIAWLPWAAFKARRQAARMGWAFNGRLAAFRTGWWNRHWYWAELDKLQALRVTRNPMDRRFGTATLVLDTAGAGALGPPLRIPFLPLRRALALQRGLAGELARRPLRW